MRLLAVASLFAAAGLVSSCSNSESAGAAGTKTNKDSAAKTADATSGPAATPWNDKNVDTAEFNRLMRYLANNDSTGKWPPANMPKPMAGAILPYYRVIAFYGNMASKRMGVLGEYPKDSMLMKLKEELKNWQKADTAIPVMPALHYIATTAQGAPGKDGKYRLRMNRSNIDTIMNWAKEINALSFIDVQIGLSTFQEEIPTFDEYLKRPTLHLGIDPEFAMNGKGGKRPGSVIGTVDAADVNWVIDHLAKIVRENNLPPKILVVHRFTNGMVTNYQSIKKVPEVQVVMDMDGWGHQTLKRSSYILYEKNQPVMFTGFKLFYKNDLRMPPNKMMTPEEVLSQTPKPIYIQYQ